MIQNSKLKVSSVLVACLIISCAKGLNYSVIEATISSWTFEDGGGLDLSTQAGAYPSATVLNNQLFLFYPETAQGLITDIYQGFGSNWDSLPGFSVQAPTNLVVMGAPNTLVFGNKIYGTWTEVALSGANTGKSQNHVGYTYGQGLWTLVDPATSCGSVACLSGPDTSQSSTNPILAVLNSKLYSAWTETTATSPANTRLYADVYNGNDVSPAWNSVLTPTTVALNRDVAQNATLPHFTVFNSKLYATWAENTAPLYPGGSASPAMVATGGGGVLVFFADTLFGNKGVVTNYNSGSWNTISQPDFTSGSTSSNSIAIDLSGNTYIAFTDSANNSSVTVMKNTAGTNSWNVVGSAGITGANATNISLAVDPSDVPYIAFEDGAASSKISVMKFNGTSWVFVGSQGMSASTGIGTSLAIDSSGHPYVAYIDASVGNAATVQEYTAGAWSALQVAGFTSSAAQYLSLKISPANVPYLAYTDSSSKVGVSIYNVGLSTWGAETVISAGNAFFPCLAFDTAGVPYVIYQDIANSSKATVMKYSAGAWSSIGTGISVGVASSPTISVDPATLFPVVAYEDGGLGQEVIVQKFNGAAFIELSNTSSTQIRFAVYNGNDSSPSWQYIDGGSNSGINYNKNANAVAPTSAIYQGKLYLSWLEQNEGNNQVRVAVYNGDDASPSGFNVDGNTANGINYNPGSNVIGPLAFQVFFNQLYLSWAEASSSGNYVLRTKVYNGNDSSPVWSNVGGTAAGGLNYDSTKNAQSPTFSIFNGNLYNFWTESGPLPPSTGIVHSSMGN